jgi:hypothetical protein
MFNFLLIFLFTFHQNPGSENDRYIAKELTNLNQLMLKGKFEDGWVIIKGDTIKTRILRFVAAKTRNSYLFCVTKNRTDSFEVYTAKQINGYIIGDDTFKTHISNGETFFIRMVKKGKAILFERGRIPGDDRFLYYIQLPNYQTYFVICPDEQSVKLIPIFGSVGSPTIRIDYYYKSDENNQKFKLFVNKFLGDCSTLKNLVQSDFYTMNDLPSVIETYNNCFH